MRAEIPNVIRRTLDADPGWVSARTQPGHRAIRVRGVRAVSRYEGKLRRGVDGLIVFGVRRVRACPCCVRARVSSEVLSLSRIATRCPTCLGTFLHIAYRKKIRRERDSIGSNRDLPGHVGHVAITQLWSSVPRIRESDWESGHRFTRPSVSGSTNNQPTTDLASITPAARVQASATATRR